MKIYKVDTKNLSGKLKELKTWAQVKSPKRIQPVLSYALDWLAPELLGTGFRLFELNDFELKAIVPANKSNLDSQGEIHQGLATNAALELARVFFTASDARKFFQNDGHRYALDQEATLERRTDFSYSIESVRYG